MKKKLLSTLLCAAMALGTLAGCGAKETASDNVVVETEEHVENETTTNEEVVEETFVESEYKEENIVFGKTETTPFGNYTIIGPLEENPNLEQYEINFDGHIFQVALPKDLGNSIEYNEDAHTVSFYNKDKSKIAEFFYTKGGFDVLDAYYSCYYAIEEFGADTTNEEIVVLDEGTLKAYQFGTSEYYNNLAYLSCWNIGTEKMHNDKMYENVGYNYRFFYGETNETFNRETVKTIMESFTFLTDEDESYAALNQKQNEDTAYLDSNNKLDTKTLEKFGLENTNLTFKPDTTITSGADSVTIKIKNVTEDNIRTYFTEVTKVVSLTDIITNSFDMKTAVMDCLAGMYTTYNYTVNDVDYVLMVSNANNTLDLTLKIK